MQILITLIAGYNFFSAALPISNDDNYKLVMQVVQGIVARGTTKYEIFSLISCSVQPLFFFAQFSSSLACHTASFPHWSLPKTIEYNIPWNKTLQMNSPLLQWMCVELFSIWSQFANILSTRLSLSLFSDVVTYLLARFIHSLHRCELKRETQKSKEFLSSQLLCVLILCCTYIRKHTHNIIIIKSQIPLYAHMQQTQQQKSQPMKKNV